MAELETKRERTKHELVEKKAETDTPVTTLLIAEPPTKSKKKE